MHQPQSTVFSSVLIGSESLLVGCGDFLLDHGFPIAMVVTDNSEIARWAEERDLPVADLDDSLPAKLATTRFEWLLSIANLRLLPKDVLAQAANGAINFHDGPLPAYAGVNAPVWALVNGEKQHGITWHLIEDGIDTGDILEQRVFDLDADETAFSLNSKCYAAGLDSFTQLVEGLQAGLPARRPQDASQRSYFARDARPAADGRLDLSRAAKDLAAQVAALDHTSYWNPMCLPKIALNGAVFCVAKAGVTDGKTAPRVIAQVTANTLTIGTGDGDLALIDVTLPDGRPIDLTEHFTPGQILDDLTPQDAAQITDLKAKLVKAERVWQAHLADFTPFECPSSY